ncbi:MAG: methyltransferase domain-containing protein [Gammaproteobacteria bacterium]|nr:methyltransferase domain-containing protein [Gammaproteobacteria bacterium]MDH3859616.1 methyltransferase domain-containing protein [Gammaproteobacteria bacterium]
MTNIKSMKLYTHVERVYRELGELGKTIEDPLNVYDLAPFDQLHYHGTDALDVALAMLGVDLQQNWLEIGSGLGGPARYLATCSEARVTALELQPDQHELALDMTGRCGLEDRVEHVCGDFLEFEREPGSFDAIVSWLSLYHIPERTRLLEKCHRLLAPSGCFYTEDLTARGDIDDGQRSLLERDLYAITLRHINDYRQDLENAGFEVELCQAMSSDWAEFARVRLAAYRADRARHLRVHGEAAVTAMTDFYTAVNRHFQSGKLGGVRLCARKSGVMT